MIVLSSQYSLPKIRGTFSGHIGKYIVFFDEFHSVVQHLFFSDTLRSKRRAVMKTIRWLLRNAGQVIVMDNEITDIDLAVLDSALAKGLNFVSVRTIKERSSF
jgi:hypothetical protein